MKAIRLIALAGFIAALGGGASLADRYEDRGLDWSRNGNDWDQVGSAPFSYNGTNRTVDAVRGRAIRALGVRPNGGDASCSTILVRFGDGNRVSLDVGNLYHMRDGRLYKVDLPGNRRDVIRVAYVCRAETGRIVNLRLYVNR